MQYEKDYENELLWNMLWLRLIPNHQDVVCIVNSLWNQYETNVQLIILQLSSPNIKHKAFK